MNRWQGPIKWPGGKRLRCLVWLSRRSRRGSKPQNKLCHLCPSFNLNLFFRQASLNDNDGGYGQTKG